MTKLLKAFVQVLFSLPVNVGVLVYAVWGFVTDNSFTMYRETGMDTSKRKLLRTRLAINAVIEGVILPFVLVGLGVIYAFGWLEDWAFGIVEADEQLRAREGQLWVK